MPAPKPRRAYSQLALNRDSPSSSSSSSSGAATNTASSSGSSSRGSSQPPPPHRFQPQHHQNGLHNALQNGHQNGLRRSRLNLGSPRLKLKSSRDRGSAASTLSLVTTGNSGGSSNGTMAVGGGSSLRTPRSLRRSTASSSNKERTVTIKCQRLNAESGRYEEVEVEVPRPVYDTLRLYNERDGISDDGNGKMIETTGGKGREARLGSGIAREKGKSESLASKIRRLLFVKN